MLPRASCLLLYSFFEFARNGKIGGPRRWTNVDKTSDKEAVVRADIDIVGLYMHVRSVCAHAIFSFVLLWPKGDAQVACEQGEAGYRWSRVCGVSGFFEAVLVLGLLHVTLLKWGHFEQPFMLKNRYAAMLL